MNKKNIFNANGLSLIELIVTLAIFGMIIMVVYPMISFTFRTSITQLNESNQRNEVRVVSTYLKNDIEYSKEITLIDSSTLRIVNSNNETINYYIHESVDNYYLVREKDGTSEFKDISDIEFVVLNPHLVKAKIVTDIANNKFTEFKIFRWNMTIAMPGHEDDIHNLIINHKVFVLGNLLEITGIKPSVNGPNSTVVFNKDLDLNGGEISVDNIYVDGDIYLNGGAILGKLDNTSSIYTSGNISIDGSSELFGNIIAPEDFTFPDFYIPQLQPDIWYADRGYTSISTPENNMRYFGSDITIYNDISDVIIVSKGDIHINHNINVSGILFAPNNEVLIDEDASFSGLIIANKISIKNKATVTFEAVEINDLPF